MKKLFLAFLSMLDCRGEITEAIMYVGGEFSRIKLETAHGTYQISITKEKENEN